MIEMYLAGVSTRRIEDVSEILWGSSGVGGDRLEPEREGVRRGRGVAKPARSFARYPYVYVDGIYLKRSWGGSLRERGRDGGDRRQRRRLPRGHRRRRGLHGVGSECWRGFLSWLKVARACAGSACSPATRPPAWSGRSPRSSRRPPTSAARSTSTATCWRRCPSPRAPKASPRCSKAIHAMESREAAEAKALEVASTSSTQVEARRRPRRSSRDGYAETLTYTQVPARALAAHHAPTTPSSASTARSAGARAWSAPSPTGRVGPHARDREAQVRGRERVGLEALPGRDSAGGVAAPDGGLSEAVGKCARILTVPRRLSWTAQTTAPIASMPHKVTSARRRLRRKRQDRTKRHGPPEPEISTTLCAI